MFYSAKTQVISDAKMKHTKLRTLYFRTLKNVVFLCSWQILVSTFISLVLSGNIIFPVCSSRSVFCKLRVLKLPISFRMQFENNSLIILDSDSKKVNEKIHTSFQLKSVFEFSKK